jgi:hypothetical protein
MEFLRNPEAAVINEGIGADVKGKLLMLSVKFLSDKSLDSIISKAMSVASSKAKTDEEKKVVDELFGESLKDRADKISLIKKILKYTPEKEIKQAEGKIESISKKVKLEKDNIQKESVLHEAIDPASVIIGLIGAAVLGFIAHRVGRKVVGSVRRGIYDIATRTAQGMERSQSRADTGTSIA